MAEYIDRAVAMSQANFIHGRWDDVYVSAATLMAMPAADVAPVRHGRWIEPPRLYYGAKQYECSLCYSDTFWNKHSITEKYPHCPNCGATMDLEG